MKIFLLLASISLFWTFFNFHLFLTTSVAREKWGKPPYSNDIGILLIIWLIALIVPVYILHIIFKINWLALFFINITLIWILGPLLLKMYRAVFGSSKGPIRDMIESVIGGIILLTIGLIVN